MRLRWRPASLRLRTHLRLLFGMPATRCVTFSYATRRNTNAITYLLLQHACLSPRVHMPLYASCRMPVRRHTRRTYAAHVLFLLFFFTRRRTFMAWAWRLPASAAASMSSCLTPVQHHYGALTTASVPSATAARVYILVHISFAVTPPLHCRFGHSVRGRFGSLGIYIRTHAGYASTHSV